MFSKLYRYVLYAAILVPGIARSANLPTQDEIDGVLKLCSIGSVKYIEGDVKGKIEFWKKGIEGMGKGTVSDLGGLLATVPAGEIKPEIQKHYNECVINTIRQFIGGDDVTCKPSDELIVRLDRAEHKVIDIDKELAKLYVEQDGLKAKINAMPNDCEGNVGSMNNVMACAGSKKIKLEYNNLSSKVARLENDKRDAHKKVSLLLGKLCG